MILTKATTDRYEEVRLFYHSLIDAMQGSPYLPGWQKDIYPAPEFLDHSIRKNELYIGMESDEIACAMVLNHDCNEGYAEFDWPTKASAGEIMVIHALGVHPRHFGKGFARQMVRAAIQEAREEKQKVLRLDVLKGNIPAERLYTTEGFRYLHTLPMFYEDTGWTDYELFEYVL